MKKAPLFIIFIFSFVLFGFAIHEGSCQNKGSAGSNAAAVKCGDWEMIPLPSTPCYLNNNKWGKGVITDYEQCIFRVKESAPFPAGWKWRWPVANVSAVKSAPAITFGQHPWIGTSTSPLLPRRIDNIETMTVSYDISLHVTGKYNLSFDIWITKTPGVTNPPEANIVREIMIWLDSRLVTSINGRLMGRVVIDGEAYKLYYAKGLKTENYTRDYFGFIKETPELKGDTKVHEFLTYLVEHKYILPTEFVRSIELCTEVWYGQGETVLNDYSVSMKTKVVGTAASPERDAGKNMVVLKARDAVLKTFAQLQYEEGTGRENIGWWTKTEDEIGWKRDIAEAGKYTVTARVACDPRSAGSTVGVTINNRTLTFTVPDTGDWLAYKDLEIGKLSLNPGSCGVSVKAVTVSGAFVCNLQSITLKK